MKRNTLLFRINPEVFLYRSLKLLRSHQLIVLLILFISLQVKGENAFQRVSLSEKNAPFAKVLSKIEKQTGYSFVYREGVLKNANTVSIEVKDILLEDALNM